MTTPPTASVVSCPRVHHPAQPPGEWVTNPAALAAPSDAVRAPSGQLSLAKRGSVRRAVLPRQQRRPLDLPRSVHTTAHYNEGMDRDDRLARERAARQNAEAVQAEAEAARAEAEAARAEAEAARAHLQAMQYVTDAALTHLGLDELLRELLGRIKAVLQADNAAILLLDEASQQLVVHLAHGPEEVVAGQMRVPVGQGVAGRIAASRQPLLVEDVRALEPVNPILREQVASLLGVPLLVADRLIGVMHVDSA